MSVTSALEFVSDWRNVAIVQPCVCDQTALSAPSCRMQRHRGSTGNGPPSLGTGTGLLSSASFSVITQRRARSASQTVSGFRDQIHIYH